MLIERLSVRRGALLVILACLIGKSIEFSCGSRAPRRRRGVPTHHPSSAWFPPAVRLQQQQTTSSELTTSNSVSSQKQTDCDELSSRISELCRSNRIDQAVELLEDAIASADNDEDPPSTDADTGRQPTEACFSIILSALVAQKPESSSESSLRLLETMFEKMKALSAKGRPELAPTAATYNALVLAWSKQTKSRDAGDRCEELLEELWTQYNATQASSLRPMRSTYVSTITALARSGKGHRAAQRVEELLEEMERHRPKHPALAPSTICVNIALHAWSRSGGRDAARRCEAILDRMEDLYFRGRKELQPNTTSFNTVIDALAKSGERGSEKRAEALLERMEKLSVKHEDLRDVCSPDQVSFNAVLNCWARSRAPKAAQRADAILRHMERRYANHSTDTRPDSTTYNTVLTAWSRSREKDAATRAEEVLKRMEKAYRKGNEEARPNAMSHNIVINAWAKSRDKNASLRAMEIFESMKELATKPGWEDCQPDVFTYTSLIDVMAKASDQSDEAVKLLEELEELYRQSQDPSLRPNIRTYTSAIHAISRSRTRPERAEAIVDRLEQQCEAGVSYVRPDVVCYDALINAYGWSQNTTGRSLKCYSIYEKMLGLYESRTNLQAKPDIITCNSILNSCAYEKGETEEEQARILEVAVRTLEEFQSRAPSFGWPNHITYANMLLAILNHTPNDPEKRSNLAEATFWQCCESGHVSVLVLNNLHKVLPWDRLSDLLGNALVSGKDENLHFNFRMLPDKWTRYAPSPKERRESPSRKQSTKAPRRRR